MRPKIKRLAIDGFRSFGKVRQTAEPGDTVSVFWGGNSQGKTSFSEAVEFLLAGKIARRELLAGAKDEFADSLRNAHLDDNAHVAVEIEVECPDGVTRVVKRTLLEDYGRAQAADCKSRLEIDGTLASEQDLLSVVGLTLFPSPLEAPVLSQHALGFLFSSSPADRAAYFRAVLDTQNLEDFRQDVAALEGLIEYPRNPEVADLGAMDGAEVLRGFARSLLACEDKEAAASALDSAVAEVLQKAGHTPGLERERRLTQLRDELARRRSSVFPLSGFDRDEFRPWKYHEDTLIGVLVRHKEEAERCDAEAAQLIQMFEGALQVPSIGGHDHSVDCPLCGTQDALTPERVAWIKNQVETAASLQTSKKSLETELRRLVTLTDATRSAVLSALPQCCGMSHSERVNAGFTLVKMQQLGAEQVLVKDWLFDLRTLWRHSTRMLIALEDVRARCDKALGRIDDWSQYAVIASSLQKTLSEQTKFGAALASYEGPARRLTETLRQRIDAASDVEGWESVIRLAADPEGALAGVSAIRAYEQAKKELVKAIKEIEKGIGKVQDKKFADLSDEITKWWKRLRPDESTFFGGVQRRSAKAKRMIDLKAGLSLTDNGSDPKLRDAVAVFSQSQLHCLGLAIFLARASTEKVGFIVLDDPVLTSDEDYRPNFASTVIEGLLAEGIQTIIVTQDYGTAKDITTRWAHRDVRRFHIVKNDASIGSEIRSEEDDLAAMISRAQPFCNSEDPEQRKTGGRKVREAIERFSKLLLVKNRQSKGDSKASVTDYDGKNFGDYGNSVKALLVQDPSHPGKLQAAHNYVTPAPHDDNPPPKSQLRTALGDLKRLKADYLD